MAHRVPCIVSGKGRTLAWSIDRAQVLNRRTRWGGREFFGHDRSLIDYSIISLGVDLTILMEEVNGGPEDRSLIVALACFVLISDSFNACFAQFRRVYRVFQTVFESGT